MAKRETVFDFLRIISMILVVVIHLSNYYMRAFPETINYLFYGIAAFFNTIARVSVPIFFMISGALLIGQEHDLDKYKKRIIKFIKILLFWSIIYILWNYFYMKDGQNLIDVTLALIFEPTKAHLWFMYAIIGIYLVLPFVQKMVQNLDEKLKKLFIILWIVGSGGLYFIRQILGFIGIKTIVNYPIPIVQGTYYLGYFIIGYLIYEMIKNLKNKDQKRYYQKSLIIFIISTLITLIATLIASKLGNNYHESFFAYRSLFMILSSISIFSLIVLKREAIDAKISPKLISSLAETSFGIYLVHVIFLNYITENYNILNINPIFGIPLLAIILIVLSHAVIKIIKKIMVIREFV